MADIKSYLLSSAAFVLLAVASVCSLLFLVSFLLDGELAALTKNIQDAMAPMVKQSLQQGVLQEEDTYLKLKTICSDPLRPDSFNDMCGLMESASINDSVSLSNYLSDQYVSTAVSTAVFQNLPLVEDIRNGGRVASFLLFVTFFMALFLIYLDTVNLEKTASRASLFCCLLSVVLLLISIMLIAFVPASVDALAAKQKNAEAMDFQSVAQYASLIKVLGDWFTGYLAKIALFYGAVAILSFSLWQFFRHSCLI